MLGHEFGFPRIHVKSWVCVYKSGGQDRGGVLGLMASQSSQEVNLQVQRESLSQKIRWKMVGEDILTSTSVLLMGMHIHTYAHVCMHTQHIHTLERQVGRHLRSTDLAEESWARSQKTWAQL